MDFNLNMEIKKEKQSLSEKLCFEDDKTYLDFESDLINLNFKVEDVILPNEYNRFVEENSTTSFRLTSLNYEELIEDQKQSCLICCECFVNSFGLLQHNLKHLKVPLINRTVFICNYCLKYYYKKSELKMHIITDHQPKQKRYPKKFLKSSNSYVCKLCNKKNMSYKSWHQHMTNVHSKVKIRCGLCSKIFKCKRYLKRHLLYVHEGVRPDWRFYKKEDNVINTTKVICPVCSVAYSNKHSLKTHIRNCHSAKTYKCKLCPSELKSRPYLLAHMSRVHYEDGQVYSCETCGKNYKSPRYLNVHKKNVHVKHKKVNN